MESRSSSPPTLVLGLLGGIASGKSLAARFLAGEDGLVISADELAHEVLEDPEVVRGVARELGSDLLDPAGKLDRARLAARVFDPRADGSARRILEGWTHPPVCARILGRIEDARTRGVPWVVLDVPLLLETEGTNGLLAHCDALVFVEADPETRDRRAREHRGWPPGEVARREAAQIPLDEKRRRADYVVKNQNDVEDLRAACERVREAVQRTHRRPGTSQPPEIG